MIRYFYKDPLDAAAHWNIFKTLLLAANTAALLIYSFVHFIFFDIPFESVNELLVLAKLFGVASSFAAGASLLLMLTELADNVRRGRKIISMPAYAKIASLAAVIVIVLLSACNMPSVSVGVKKDLNTGLSTSYKNMEPEKVFLVMNNEVLTHTDIPLGESFLLVNDGIKGMQVRNGKVTVGCSLSISDKDGKVLMNEKDLFAGHDQFNEADAKMLKCTINTGEPMKWEEKYKVDVTFWDKNGTGKIENSVTVRMIDIP